jgi:hypothetical protein
MDFDKIETTETDMKVPGPRSFLETKPVTRSVDIALMGAETQFGGDMRAGPKDWGLEPTSFSRTNKTVETEFAMGMGPGKLESDQPVKNAGPETGFSTMYIEQTTGGTQQLQPEPIYYEKYSSFTSSSSPQALLQDIAQVLTARSNVDHEPCMEKNKIKGVAYENNGRCTFKIRLYQSNTADRILCEFQRRSGCVVSFNKFYRRTLSDIPSHVSTKVGNGDWISNIDRVEAQADAEGAEPSVQLDDATAVNLISMAGCDNVDVQREGAQALANVAKFPLNQVKLAEMYQKAPEESRLMQLLQKLLSSMDTELCRSGSVLLCCLSTQESMKAVLASNLLDKMVAVLDAPQSFETSDSKRQVAQALATLSSTCAQQMIGLASFKECLKVLKHIHTNDASLKQNALIATANLNNATQM